MFMKGQYYFQVIAVYMVDGHCSGAPLSYKDLALKLGFGAYTINMHHLKEIDCWSIDFWLVT